MLGTCQSSPDSDKASIILEKPVQSNPAIVYFQRRGKPSLYFCLPPFFFKAGCPSNVGRKMTSR